MTPYMTTPHSSSQTPRYGQTTPSQHGQFLRPAAPVSNRPNLPNYRASPYTSQSPRVMPRRVTQEEEDWDKASSSWGDAHSRMKGTPRDEMGRTTPRG